MSERPVVVRAVPLDVDSTDALSDLRSSRPLLFLAEGAAVVVAPTCGLQEGVVRQWHCFIEQGVEGLLVDPSFRELHLMEDETDTNSTFSCICLQEVDISNITSAPFTH